MKTWEKDAKKRLCSKASFSWLTNTYCGGVGGGWGDRRGRSGGAGHPTRIKRSSGNPGPGSDQAPQCLLPLGAGVRGVYFLFSLLLTIKGWAQVGLG